ncbi:DoxX family protein [Brevundimonas sp. NIBR11]|uniref:DoxX family protein n=1 Tax=Brevundimonas sp. NIBR11 TaxID=3015999 RepID=UPI0022F0C8B5|nr:DoxX family protein [Brevundimonas sp. NIBR11]
MKASPMVWVGRVLTGLFALFMLGASIYPKFFMPDVVAANMTTSGWTPDKTLLLGIIELSCLVLYLIPRTALFGAVLMMAYLGGALATNLRVDNPLFSHTLFSVYLGLVMWGGLWLRDARVRAVFPILR